MGKVLQREGEQVQGGEKVRGVGGGGMRQIGKGGGVRQDR